MPLVIALMGLPGSGKTTIADRLARARDLTVVSRDTIRAAMFRPCGYTEVEKETAYRALLLGVAACLELGRSCVVEGMPFSCASEIDDVRPRIATKRRSRGWRHASMRRRPRRCGSTRQRRPRGSPRRSSIGWTVC